MRTPVLLSDIPDAMQMQSDEVVFYLHRPTAWIIGVSDEAMQAAEENYDESVEPEELAEARGILAAEGEYLSLPDRFEVDEYRMMERFAADTGDWPARAELVDTLRGSGAFRRFKDSVRRLGLAEDCMHIGIASTMKSRWTGAR